MTVALAYDARCLAHDNGSMLLDERARAWLDVGHSESPERVSRAYRVLEASGVAGRLERVEIEPASDEQLQLVHSAAHVEAIRRACARDSYAWVGPEARVGPGSWQPAVLSAGAAIAAVDWACEHPAGRAYVLTRPPGHHASRAQALGFCLFNNVALAASRAQRAHGVGRVAIVDWDVHHGRMSVTAEGFREMMAQVVEVAQQLTAGRVVAVQEGGYSTDHMPFCVLATVEALAELEPALEGDPMELDLPPGPGAAEREAVRSAREAAGL